MGEVEELSEEVAALIRLQHPFVVNRFTEVSLNTKYVFVLLGPKGNMSKYVEIGRCMATLLSDDVG